MSGVCLIHVCIIISCGDDDGDEQDEDDEGGFGRCSGPCHWYCSRWTYHETYHGLRVDVDEMASVCRMIMGSVVNLMLDG